MSISQKSSVHVFVWLGYRIRMGGRTSDQDEIGPSWFWPKVRTNDPVSKINIQPKNMVGIGHFACLCGQNDKISFGFCMTGEDPTSTIVFSTHRCPKCGDSYYVYWKGHKFKTRRGVRVYHKQAGVSYQSRHRIVDDYSSPRLLVDGRTEPSPLPQ